MHLRRTLALGLAVASLTLGVACSNNSTSGDTNGTTSNGSGSKGTINLSGQDFGEMQIMASLYQQVLENAGYTVNVKLVATRDIYVAQLTSGGVDIAPDYLAGMADFLNSQANGPDAPLISSHSAAATLQALKPLAAKANITMLQPAKATDQNAFVVTKAFAQQHHLVTLSDLAALHLPITLAAPTDCRGRSDCEGGLTKVYHLNIVKIIPLDFDSPQAKQSVTSGESQLGEVGTTDGALSQEGLQLLQDDKGIQPAQNLIPAANSTFIAAHPDVATLLNKLSSTLTTADLAAMDLKLAVQRAKPADVAKAYLESKGLLG